jgi:hypothetical protein
MSDTVPTREEKFPWLWATQVWITSVALGVITGVIVHAVFLS